MKVKPSCYSVYWISFPQRSDSVREFKFDITVACGHVTEFCSTHVQGLSVNDSHGLEDLPLQQVVSDPFFILKRKKQNHI